MLLITALGEFSNVQNAPARAYAYDGVAVQCSQISYKPGETICRVQLDLLYSRYDYLSRAVRSLINHVKLVP